ncbi:MAG TPA: Hsp20/alpha crystallin family protein [Streptosporangiaceae bacterium]|nr:Hsp20/alpha crystallin family protein [Streptosporangiaceae bacterium]
MYLTTFDPFANDFRRRLARAGSVLPLDGVRRENDVLLRFDVPGIDPASIEITVDRGVLQVSAQRQEEHGESDRFFVRERPMGTVTRRVYLSDNLNADGIEAAYTNGVLEVTVPVAERAKPRKVEIRAAEAAKELAN